MGAIDHILYWQGSFPDDDIAQLIDSEAESKPLLRAILKKSLQEHQNMPEDYVGAIYASYILAFFRDSECFGLLLQLLALPQASVETLFKDFLTQSFPKVLASCYNGQVEPLSALIANIEAPELSRIVALVALTILYRIKKVTKADLLAVYEKLLATDHSPNLLACMAEEIADLHLYELEEKIVALYGQEKIDKEQFSQDHFRKLLESDFANPRKFFLIEDVFEELTGREYKAAE